MKKRKTIALVMAAFIVLPLVFSGGLQVFQSYLHHRAEERLNGEVLASISVPLHQVKWVEEEREVMIEGKMFDLKTYQIANGVFIATGVWDEKETEVMKLLSNFNEKEQTGLIIRVLLLIQTIAFSLGWILSANAIAFSKRYFPFLQPQSLLFFARKIDQPPRRSFHFTF